MDAEIDGLFVVEPDAFIASRDALVKRLKAEKRKEEAATVAAMRRLAPAVWAMNTVARSHSALVETLLQRGAAARAAQEALLTGGTVGLLHEAVEQRRVVISDLVGRAVDVLAGKGDALIPQLRAGFEAASIDPPQGSLLQRGRLFAIPAAGEDLSPFGMTAPRATLKLVPPLSEPHLPEPVVSDELAERTEKARQSAVAAAQRLAALEEEQRVAAEVAAAQAAALEAVAATEAAAAEQERIERANAAVAQASAVLSALDHEGEQLRAQMAEIQRQLDDVATRRIEAEKLHAEAVEQLGRQS